MNCTSNDLLAYACFTLQEHRACKSRNAAHFLHDILKAEVGPDNLTAGKLLKFFLKVSIVICQEILEFE